MTNSLPDLLRGPARLRRLVSAVLAILTGGVAASVLAGPPAFPAPEVPNDRLSPTELILRAAERDEATRHAVASYGHDEEIVTERFDPAGRRLSTQSQRRRNVAGRKTLGTSDTLRADGNSSGDSGDFTATVDLRKMATRFDLRREPDGSVDGRPCYVVGFRPRVGTFGDDTREEKVMRQLAGRFWLARDDLSIVRSEANLTRPVTVAWIASVYRLSFDYRAQVLPDTGRTVPARFTLDLGVKAPLYHVRERKTTTMTSFRQG